MNTHLPLVSIALCTYNGETFIREQLDSIINQSYTNLEIIIVDDCSSDNTVNILRAYEAKYSNIAVFINEGNRGVNSSFAKAISLCNGELIAISDQDDIWLLDKIEKAYQYIGNNVMLYSNSMLIDENGVDLHRRKFKKNKLYSGSDPRALSFFNEVAGHTIIFKSSIKKYILPIPRCSHYDWWIAFVSINLGSIVYLDTPFVMHRIHLYNVSRDLSSVRQDSYKAMLGWTEAMLSIPKLKNKAFFDELYSILNIDKIRAKKIKLLLFQIKYRKFIFTNKGFFSTINRARKLEFVYIPEGT